MQAHHLANVGEPILGTNAEPVEQCKFNDPACVHVAELHCCSHGDDVQVEGNREEGPGETPPFPPIRTTERATYQTKLQMVREHRYSSHIQATHNPQVMPHHRYPVRTKRMRS